MIFRGYFDKLSESPLVIVQVSFQQFLNLGNPWKPTKTWELGNMDTHVPFLRNLTNLLVVGAVETYRNLQKPKKSNGKKNYVQQEEKNGYYLSTLTWRLKKI